MRAVVDSESLASTKLPRLRTRPSPRTTRRPWQPVYRRRIADDDDDDDVVYVAADWYNNQRTWRHQQVNWKFMIVER